MMRARLGIDKTKSWADWAEEEEEAAEPTKTLEAATAEQFKPRLLVRRDMMTMSETKTNDTMKKTENTMDDASECVSARTCGSHAPRRMRTHDAKHLSRSQQNKNPSNTPMAMERSPF